MSQTIVQEEQAVQHSVEIYKMMYESLIAQVHDYYREELVLRGDKILNREYCQYFGIEQRA
jgi:hypothetical protein